MSMKLRAEQPGLIPLPFLLFNRATVVTSGDEQIIEQIVKRLPIRRKLRGADTDGYVEMKILAMKHRGVERVKKAIQHCYRVLDIRFREQD